LNGAALQTLKLRAAIGLIAVIALIALIALIAITGPLPGPVPATRTSG
jgi:hypothetical protein